MKLKFIKPVESQGVVKAAVHLSGKLGFSQAAIKELNIDEKKYLKIGVDEEENSDKAIIYMIVTNVNDGDGFKVNKAGKYYYVRTKKLFTDLGYDYKRKKILFDISLVEDGKDKIYKLTGRALDRKKVK